MSVNYITDEVKSVIGAETPLVEAIHPIEAGEVRRFHHATMDQAPRYFDADWAASSRYGAVVAPPAFPTHAFRRVPNSPDPLDAMDEPDFDGVSRSFNGLPKVNVPLPRLVNGGYEYELYRYAKFGEKILRRSRYKDIVQRDGRTGPMVLIIIEEFYTNADGDLLIKATNTQILR
jgi:hypothetical protein